MPFASLTHGKEPKHESIGREEAAEEGREGSQDVPLHPFPPFSPSSSSSSSSSSLTTSRSSSCSCSSLCSPSSSPLSRPARPVVPASLGGIHSEVSSSRFVDAHPASFPLPAPLRLADSASAGDSLIPVQEPTGFRRMPRDPGTGRRICFYFNHTGCTAGARCPYAHAKVDISLITPGAFHKPVIPFTGLSSLPSSSFSSPGAMHPQLRQQHPLSFPVGAGSTPLPPSLPPSVSGAPGYVMYYICLPPSYPSSFPPSYPPGLPPYCHGGISPPMPLIRGGGRGGGGGGGAEGRWRDSQGFYHPMQEDQQAFAAMEAGWEGGPMKGRGAEMQYHHQHDLYQQQDCHDYQQQQYHQQPYQYHHHHQQQPLQQSEYVRESEEDW